MNVTTWLVIAVILIVIELITVSLTSIWFAIGAICSAFCTLFTDNLWPQLIVFIAVSVILFIFTRPFAMKHLHLGKEKTNIDSIIGQQAVVTETIDNIKGTGHAKINGLDWTARSVDETAILPKDSVVTVKEVRGVKLMVEPFDQIS